MKRPTRVEKASFSLTILVTEHPGSDPKVHLDNAAVQELGGICRSRDCGTRVYIPSIQIEKLPAGPPNVLRIPDSLRSTFMDDAAKWLLLPDTEERIRRQRDRYLKEVLSRRGSVEFIGSAKKTGAGTNEELTRTRLSARVAEETAKLHPPRVYAYCGRDGWERGDLLPGFDIRESGSIDSLVGMIAVDLCEGSGKGSLVPEILILYDPPDGWRAVPPLRSGLESRQQPSPSGAEPRADQEPEPRRPPTPPSVADREPQPRKGPSLPPAVQDEPEPLPPLSLESRLLVNTAAAEAQQLLTGQAAVAPDCDALAKRGGDAMKRCAAILEQSQDPEIVRVTKSLSSAAARYGSARATSLELYRMLAVMASKPPPPDAIVKSEWVLDLLRCIVDRADAGEARELRRQMQDDAGGVFRRVHDESRNDYERLIRVLEGRS